MSREYRRAYGRDFGQPTICVDFDGVLHSYVSGWQGVSKIPDPPMPGAMRWLLYAVEWWTVAIYSSRSNSWRGRRAMRQWVRHHLMQATLPMEADDAFGALWFPKRKPPAVIYLDDRAWRFEGEFPTVEQVGSFRPWRLEK